MSTSNTTTSDGAIPVPMTPFFHFIGEDHLIFESWRPTSRGAIVGACLGLLVLALFERWVNAMSPVVLDHLRQRALRKMPTNSISRDMSSSRRTSSDIAETRSEAKRSSTLPRRTVPPFIAMVDLPRGILYAFQRLLGFVMMLAVMTFNAGYIISLVVGLGLGEMFFGRVVARVSETHSLKGL